MVDNDQYDDKMKTIDLAQGEEWKNLRKIMSPTFTSGKLKSMMEPMSDIGDKAMEYLSSQCDKPIGMKKFFQGYALDTICRCGFGIDTNTHEDQDNPIANAGREAFAGFMVTNWLESIFTQLFYFMPGLEAKFPTLIYPEAFFRLNDIILGNICGIGRLSESEQCLPNTPDSIGTFCILTLNLPTLSTVQNNT